MQNNKVYYLLFHSIHDVLKSEKALKSGGTDYELTPVPRNLSTDCGMCIRIDGDFDAAKYPSVAAGLDKCYVYDGQTYTLLGL